MALCGGLGLMFIFLLANITPGDCQLPGQLEFLNFQRSHNDTMSDLIFLLDTSGSLWYYDYSSRTSKNGFTDEKVFVNSLLNHIRVSLPSTRVSVIMFGSSSTIEINYISNLSPHNHKCNFKRDFQKLRFRSGMTNMHDAFDHAWDILFGGLSGNKRPTQQVKTSVILLTDGMWNDGGDPAPIAQKLKNNDIEIFSVGVSNGVSMNVLRQLATDDSHAFRYRDFKQFRELSTYLRGDPYEVDWLTAMDQSLCGSCDKRAICACGLLSGEYKCACKAGYYGSGYINDCKGCPISTYKDFQGFAERCTSCPANSRHDRVQSERKSDCQCNVGYDGDPAKDTPCTIKMCGTFPVPPNSYIKGGTCKREYQSECELLCQEGYDISGGSGVRTCVLDGLAFARWSGNDPYCQQIVCSPLQVLDADPPLGNCGTSILVYKTVCTFKCKEGFILSGSKTRQCQSDRTWSGGETRCEAIKCPKLNSISLSQVNPPVCIQQDMRFHSRCNFECPRGYNFKGTNSRATQRFCRTNGTWTDEYRPCIDVEPPKITCPNDIKRDTDLRKDHSEITWDDPEYSDNSINEDPNAELEVTSNFKSPQVFKIGTTSVQYTVKDGVGFTAPCSFDVTIEDKESPYYTSCPGDIFQETTKNGERVNWVVPQFVDNSNMPPKVFADHTPGVFFPLGERFVQYTATDNSGNVNASCTFKVHVKAKGCPKYSAPLNGALACNAFGVANTLCQPSCSMKFDFAFKPAAAYVCANGIWTAFGGPPPPWPDCSVRYTPGAARIAYLPQFFYYSGDCRDESAQQQIKENFVSLMSKYLPPNFCAFQADCNVEHVNVFCGNTTASKRRRRSSVREVYVRVDIVAKEKAGSQQSVSELEGVLNNEARPRMDASAKAADWSPLRQSTDLEYRTYSLTQAEAYCSDSGAVVGKCHSLQTQCDGLYVPHSQCQCNQGSGNIEKCIRCPAGTHYNILEEKCVNCKPGTYQNQEGKFECNSCPEGTWTLGDDKKNFTACRAKCAPGYYSPSGLAKCYPCPSGKYSSGDMNTACTACPAGTTTILPASRGREECGMKCAPGTYSVNGVEPCKPCGAGFYQPGIGAMSCIECDGSKSTYGTGTDSANMCVEINDCTSNPCNNGGSCLDLKHGYRCACPAGYRGKDCETEKDECISDPCYQGATCVDKVNGYECVCAAGFIGKDCDISTFNCNQNPCQNGGNCKVQPPGFSCECAAGFGGTFCEMKVDHCVGNPCNNGATCKSLTEGFKCFCSLGYNGDRCQNNIDECAGEPCKNGAKCEDGVNDYTCKCKPGYAGSQCETDVNECSPNPCQNGGRCVDKVNAFECLCNPTYAGDTCQRHLSSDYDLNFPLRVATSMAIVRNIPDLSAVTIAFWMRTTDTDNPGTPLSYANKVNGKIQDNALVLQDVGAFVLYVNSEKLFIGTSADDGKWHHIAVTWDSNGGKWFFYKDGQQMEKYSVAFQPNSVIRGGGYMVLGQEQDALGDSFSPEEAFTGDISQMHVWDHALKPDDVYNLVHTCKANEGNVKAWADFRESLQGVFIVTDRSYVCDYNSALRGFLSVRENRLPNNDQKQLDNLSEEQCAQACLTESAFPCRSFDYKKAEKKCYLSRVVSSTVATIPTEGFDYYEMSCMHAIGVESKAISDIYLTASSSLDSTSQPKDGRLNNLKVSNVQGYPDSSGGWIPQTINVLQYFQVDLKSPQKITSVATQGADRSSDWTTSYKLEYSSDGSNWQYYPQTLSGNTDSGSVVRHELNTFTARYVKFRPQAWNGRIALRVEIFGCVADPIPPPPASIASPCGDPGTPLNGKKSSTDFRDGSDIYFSCNVGYSLYGSTTRRCNDGKWNGTTAYCKDVDECTTNRPCGHHCSNTAGSFKCLCRQGYKLNKDGRKCDDVDECGGNSPCAHFCINTEGSFTCSCRPGYKLNKDGRTCDAPIPTVSLECRSYKVLSDADRKVTFSNKGVLKCDSSLVTKWYRFSNVAGASITESCVPTWRCGTHAPGWLNGKHPTEGEGIVTRQVCYHWSGDCCQWKNNIRVRNCGGFYVYELQKTPGCQMRYCGGQIPAECRLHTLISDPNRKSSFSNTNVFQCDKALIKKWYRFSDSAGGEMPELCVPQRRCGTHAPGWLNGKHPTEAEGIVTRQVCYHWSGGCCHWKNDIRIRNCGGFYVYELQKPPVCNLRYCGGKYPVASRRRRRAIAQNECTNTPCNAGATCVDLHFGYRCICKPGYLGQTCQSSSPCGDPGIPLHGKKSSTNYNHGSVITFSCDVGYTLQGSSTRTCSTGMWSGTSARCNDVDECTTSRPCGHHCSNTVGSFKCTCRPGYKLNKDGRTCDDVNECALGVCSHTCYNTPGSFRCACPSGMELLPSGRTCKDKDECVTSNGGCAQACENDYLSHKCHCYGGYNLLSNKCTEISCPGLSAPAQGTKSSNGELIYGNLVNFQCNQGYKPIGSTKRVCSADGQWSGSQPRCQAVICVEVGVPKNGGRQLSNHLNYGSVASFSCNSGYALVGSQKRTCENRGSWSGSQPRCVRSDCQQLSAPVHGKIEGFRTEIGSTVRVSCDKGYMVYPDSASFRKCGSNNQWSGQDPTCILIDCGDPGTPWHGFLSGSRFTYNSTVSYSCRAKHHLDGDVQRVCQATGQWSGEQPRCLERSCGKPGIPAHGFTIGSNNTYGNTVQFACNQGYTLVGSQSRTCQNTGKWSGTQPSCQIKSCGDPGSPSNGFRIGDKFTFGERVVFDCDPGYKLQGSISRMCQADGTWSGSQPTCAQSNCGQILHGPSGTFQSTNFPNNYPDNEYCTWKIQVPQGKKVRLDFTEFRTEDKKDFVLIYDTDKTDPIVVFSGVKDRPRALTSSGNSIRVRFISNAENANNGFKVTYKQTDCGGIYTSQTGEIRSPGFPNSYPPNLSCTWLIFMEDRKIALRLPEFNTENAYDRLEVAHGPWVTSPLEIAWSGPSPLYGDVVTKQYMWIHFITSARDDRVYKGFRATYKPYDPYAKR